jgi:hypothetical protein
MIYKWKPGRWLGIPAQVAGDRIETIRAERGRVHAADLVDDARPEAAPLHVCFEWDDTAAAEKYRLQQARQVLENLVVVPVEAPESPATRAFIAIPVGDSNTPHDYQPLHLVMSSEELRRKALRAALEDLNRLKVRYAELRELTEVWKALEQVPAAAVA